MNDDRNIHRLPRRDFVGLGSGLSAAAMLPSAAPGAAPRLATGPWIAPPPGKRRLGRLEVSSIGLGMQNMARKYETTVPYRPDMIALIRAAYDQGVTFFDSAEAYGPHECERILGDAIAPFRNDVVITSKFAARMRRCR